MARSPHHDRQKKKNVTLLVVLIALSILMFALSLVKRGLLGG